MGHAKKYMLIILVYCGDSKRIFSRKSPFKFVQNIFARCEACIEVEGWHFEMHYKLETQYNLPSPLLLQTYNLTIYQNSRSMNLTLSDVLQTNQVVM
jgi:hypothetical protein